VAIAGFAALMGSPVMGLSGLSHEANKNPAKTSGTAIKTAFLDAFFHNNENIETPFPKGTVWNIQRYFIIFLKIVSMYYENLSRTTEG
jgi:hypothetical protein